MATMTVGKKSRGTLALLGGGEWQDGCRPIDEYLLEASGASEVVVLPTASAFERPERAVDRAVTWFEGLGATVRPVMVLNRRDAQDDANVKALKGAAFVYLSDGSPLHLRSVLKESSLLAVLVAGYRNGGVLAASGAGATVLGDPMVDPRGGAYTVGLGRTRNRVAANPSLGRFVRTVARVHTGVGPFTLHARSTRASARITPAISSRTFAGTDRSAAPSSVAPLSKRGAPMMTSGSLAPGLTGSPVSPASASAPSA